MTSKKGERGKRTAFSAGSLIRGASRRGEEKKRSVSFSKKKGEIPACSRSMKRKKKQKKKTQLRPLKKLEGCPKGEKNLLGRPKGVEKRGKTVR